MLFYLGEFATVEDVSTQQIQNREIVYGADGEFSVYKWHMLQRRSPKVLVLGSSRVMSFRSQFFHLNEDDVYNAGMGMGNGWRALWVLEKLKAQSKLPDVLILSVDQDWFLPDHTSPSDDNQIPIPSAENALPDLYHIFNRVRAVVGDMIENKYELADILDHRDPFYDAYSIGYNSVSRSTGFRWDGSRIINPTALNITPDENRFFNARGRIANSDGGLAWGDDTGEMAFEFIQQLIDFCDEHDIQLITFSPPYAPTIYKEMQATGNYDYIPKAVDRLQMIFDESPFYYFDFTDGVWPHVADENYLDGTHGSEFVYLNLYIEMLKETKAILGEYSDITYLESFATQPSAISQYEVFGINQ